MAAEAGLELGQSWARLEVGTRRKAVGMPMAARTAIQGSSGEVRARKDSHAETELTWSNTVEAQPTALALPRGPVALHLAPLSGVL